MQQSLKSRRCDSGGPTFVRRQGRGLAVFLPSIRPKAKPPVRRAVATPATPR
jgi:hypothetical protein